MRARALLLQGRWQHLRLQTHLPLQKPQLAPATPPCC
jgi:hypothetical protein